MNARQFSAAIRELKRVPSQVAQVAAREISQVIQDGFDSGTDPYGRPWRRLARATIEKGRRPPPLTASGAGRRSVTVRPAQGAGLSIHVGLQRMIYHQFGGKSHLRGHRRNKKFGTAADLSPGRSSPPKRSFLPFDKMPQSWLDAYQRALDQVLSQTKVARHGR